MLSQLSYKLTNRFILGRIRPGAGGGIWAHAERLRMMLLKNRTFYMLLSHMLNKTVWIDSYCLEKEKYIS